MEKFVIGLFQEQLSKFIVGFRPEQVNANLLNGKGEIHHVELNCNFLNEELANMTGFVQLERAHVSKVSFHVSSWTNLRKSPICIDIEHVTAVLTEPLEGFLSKDQRGRRQRGIKQVLQSQLASMIAEGLLPKPRGPYNLFDRILDNLTIEVRRIDVTFQPWGKFKTRRAGPWTPPSIKLQLAGIRLVSVNEYGQEAPPEEIWRHNQHHHKHHEHGTLLIYKKLEMEYQISIVRRMRPDESRDSSEEPAAVAVIPLIRSRDNKAEVQFAIKRRVRDGEWLAAQADATIPTVEVDIAQDVVPDLAHVVAAGLYCYSKDRAFVDPLKPEEEEEKPEPIMTIEATIEEEEEVEEEAEVPATTSEETEEGVAAVDISMADELSSSSLASSDEEEEESGDEHPFVEEEAEAAETTTTAAKKPQRPAADDRPVIVLPNGIVIYEKISLSVSLHHVTVKGMYADETGYVQTVAKGCVAEMIWPKVTQDKGGYVQGSVSYISVEERFGSRIRTLLIGGVQCDDSGPVEVPAKPLGEVGRDETFPLYEDRCVRPDPIGLRHSFPAQALGLKTTVNWIPKLSVDPEAREEEIMVLHEVGVDRFDIVLDSHAWCRTLRFAMNVAGGGFDPRWHSGDWSDFLTPDMLVQPNEPLNLEECLQETKQMFLDDNEFISSDLFHATTRVTNVSLRIPAAINEDVRSCDVLIKVDESMLVVASALPRTLLNDDSSKKESPVDFPDDPSDVAYQLVKSEDPSDRQRGILTSHSKSTFRFQLTHKGVSIRLVPIIPVNAGREPQQLLAPSDMTMVVCFEGEPPESPESNLTTMVVFTSILAHRFEVNFDFDLVASAICTLSVHTEEFVKTMNTCIDLIARATSSPSDVGHSAHSEKSSMDSSIRKTLRGRKVLVRRQISRSRETGGLSVGLALRVAEVRCCAWRQNVPCRSPLRPNKKDNKGRVADPVESYQYLSLLKLIDCGAKGIDFGIDVTFLQSKRRIVVKSSLSELHLKTCAFSSERGTVSSGTADETKSGFMSPDNSAADLVEIVTFGASAKTEHVLAFRIEEALDETRSWALSADFADGVISGRVEELETLCLLIVEALLMPAWSRSSVSGSHRQSSFFPEGTVGGLFLALLPGASSVDQLASPDLDQLEISNEVSTGSVPGRRIDAFLRTLVSIIPDSVKTLLLRVSLENVLVHIPVSESSAACLSEIGGCGLLLCNSGLLVSYFADERGGPAIILETLAKKGETWTSLVPERDEGLRHGLSSRQSFLVFDMQNGEDTKTEGESLVEAFDFGYSYAKSKAVISKSEDLSIHNVARLEDFFVCLIDFVDRCKLTASNIVAIIRALGKTEKRKGKEGEVVIEQLPVQANPVSMACSSAVDSVRSVKMLLRRLHNKLGAYDESMNSALLEKEKEINALRLLVFSKETERLSALALFSSEARGWLRLGAPQRTGQRGLMSCMLWPQWSILRRSLLMLYAGPGEYDVVGVISLVGASLRELAGGQRKRDLKRAFGIVESSGTVYFVMAESDAEYFSWIRALRRAIHVYSPVSIEADPLGLENPDQGIGPSLQTTPDSSSHSRAAFGAPAGVDNPHSSCIHPNPSGGARPLGKSLSRAVQAAKATGQSVVERGRRRRGGEREENETFSADAAKTAEDIGHPPAENPPASENQRDDAGGGMKRQQLRTRFAGVGQVTKRGFGSALQAAKQKGKEVAEKRRSRMISGPDDFQEELPSQQRGDVVNVGSAGAVPSGHAGDVSVPSAVSREQTSWSCAACTFVNEHSGSRCQVCDTVRSTGEAPSESWSPVNPANSESDRDSSAVPDYPAASEGAPDREVPVEFERYPESYEGSSEDGERDVPRRGMKERFGAAVRSARRGIPGSERKLNFRRPGSRQDSTDEATMGAPDAVRLRKVSLSGPLNQPAHPFGAGTPEAEDIPMKKLEGHWSVQVEALFGSNDGVGVGAKSADQPSTDTATPADRFSKHNENTEVSVDRSDPEEMRDSDQKLLPLTKTSGESSPYFLEQIPLGDDSLPALSSLQTSNERTEVSFRIQVFKQTESENRKGAVLIKELSDIVALHTTLSETVARVPVTSFSGLTDTGRAMDGRMNSILEGALGLTALDAVRTTGKLLGGLLEMPAMSKTPAYYNYQAAIIGAFLGSMLECPLPIDGLAVLAEFLMITVASTENATPRDSSTATVSTHSHLAPASAKEIFSLSSLCDTELTGAESQCRVAERLSATSVSSNSHVEILPSSPTQELHASLTPHSASDQFRDAMHSAFMKVMEERDEAHAKRVSANVLHVHEMEQQRKKAAHLATQLETVKRMAAATGQLFLSEQEKQETEKLRQFEKNMQQDSEAELLSLCQQLSSEIASRTSASLEIVRLKESRKIEKEHEAAEKVAMREEITMLREQLAEERRNKDLARQESGSWRQSFEQVVKVKDRDFSSSWAQNNFDN